MKTLPTLLISVLSFSAYAQNYQCLQTGVKHYFTNSNGYLRGIRIDSVKTLADSTIFYPYHTPRGYYNPTGSGTLLDSNGGSWLGKTVVKRNDGTFLFDNLWNDTVVIKTQANPGDTWIFYHDTTSLYYEANLVSTDTMTILGGVDSIKTILITARNPSGIVTTDPVDSFPIIVSKNSGFVQVFDLYTFPYHAADSVYMHGYDFYLDHVIPYTGRDIPNQLNSIFSLIDFIDPTLAQLYQWNVGDVYEFSMCNGIAEPYPICNPKENYNMDTIINVNMITGGVSYSYSGWAASYIPPSTAPPIYSTAPNSGLLTADSTLLFDTTLMPEEFRQPFFWTYSPDDSSYCIVNTLYSIQKNFEIDRAEYIPPFEVYYGPSLYKSPLGLLSSFSSAGGAGLTGSLFAVNSQNLIYYTRSGISCGSYLTESVAEINAPNTTITLYPNPATTSLTIQSTCQLTIQSTNQPINQIAITNLLGQTVYTQNYNTDQIQIDISTLPTGMYFVKINGSEVRKFVKE